MFFSVPFSYIQNCNYDQHKEIILISDAAGAQNKNILMTSLCSWFSCAHDLKVTQVFPVCGHSYNQFDRNFGLYGNKIKKNENIYLLSEYVSILKE